MSFTTYLAHFQLGASWPVDLDYLREPLSSFPPQGTRGNCWKRKPPCEKHNQVPTLFCEEDLELLCPQCKVSSDHLDHTLTPIEKAAASHRRKLKSYIEPLRKQVEEAERGLKHFFPKEQDAIHARLLMEEKDDEKDLADNKRQTPDPIFTLKKSALEVFPGRYGVTDGLERIYKYENLKTPTDRELRCLSTIFKPAKNVQHISGILTLYLKTSHHKLINSENRKSMMFDMRKPNCPPGFSPLTFYTVLGSEGFDAGRRFWQVEVRGTGVWSFGICKESLPGNANTAPFARNACWQFHHQTNAGSIWDLASGSRWMDLHLDYESGEILLYNLNDRSYLFILIR
ncbi:hypothetical protein HPG69_017209 [Diceros bicornis minor]|uniref:Uncharacterized protein n=1 Tax=Diceros bicornis minor TaxID=77932 RepID=A0A7J7ECW2_DICBM|nr:hypothetical protein HPG69_017209 [Diceros bicornis minor]